MMKRLIAMILLVAMVCTMGLAESEPETTPTPAPEASAEPEAEPTPVLPALPTVNLEGRKENDPYLVKGPIYEDKTLADFDKNSPALYTCRIIKDSNGYIERSIYSEKILRIGNAVTADVLYVDPIWIIARYNGKIAYVKRRRIVNMKTVDESTTPPFGVQKHTYIATTRDVTEVRRSMDAEDDFWVALNPGTTISIWAIQDGWAIVNYWRRYGYIQLSDLENLIPVSPTDEPLFEDSPIAAYTSYYKMDQTESNFNRMHNIALGCKFISRVYMPGDIFDGNEIMGPYNAAKGYLEAGALSDGEVVQGYGGGTCQVSSTLYNAVLQLPGLDVLYRRAHGENGADYLPMHVDAAVGGSGLNFRWRNRYDFAVRVEAHTSSDGALCILIYQATEAEIAEHLANQ